MPHLNHFIVEEHSKKSILSYFVSNNIIIVYSVLLYFVNISSVHRSMKEHINCRVILGTYFYFCMSWKLMINVKTNRKLLALSIRMRYLYGLFIANEGRGISHYGSMFLAAAIELSVVIFNTYEKAANQWSLFQIRLCITSFPFEFVSSDWSLHETSSLLSFSNATKPVNDTTRICAVSICCAIVQERVNGWIQ